MLNKRDEDNINTYDYLIQEYLGINDVIMQFLSQRTRSNEFLGLQKEELQTFTK